MPTGWLAYINPVQAGTMAFSVVGSGAEFGLPYVDIRMAGVPSATANLEFLFATQTTIVASVGQVWNHSAFLRLVGGTTAGTTAPRAQIQEWTGGGTTFAASGVGTSIAIGASLQRYEVTRTLVTAAVDRIRPGVTIPCTGGAAIDMTVRVYAPQAELGGFATSPVLTTGSAATRPADVLRLSAATLGLTGAAGTIIWRGTLADSAGGAASARLVTIEQTPQSLSRVVIGRGADGRLFAQIQDDAQATVALATHSVADPRGLDVTMGITWGGGTCRIKIGSDAALDDASAPSPTGAATLAIGARSDGSAPTNALHRRVLALARRCGDSEFDALVAGRAAA
jgi:hypothetical protein